MPETIITPKAKRTTIIEAVKQVMKAHGSPMTAKQAYEAILAGDVYQFHAQDPAHVVLTQIRRHSEGIEFPSAASTKHFRIVDDNKFQPLEKPKKRTRRVNAAKKNNQRDDQSELESTLSALQSMHKRYLSILKGRLLSEIKNLSSDGFENFSRALLEVYGFVDTKVTRVGSDGGIDGYGKLQVGLAHLNVSFQCKRWTKGNINRVEIDRFRGASQGDFEQGIFFATTSFSPGAIDASIKRGAIPIVLIDGDAIVDLMVQRRFGVDAESLVIPIYALDLALE